MQDASNIGVHITFVCLRGHHLEETKELQDAVTLAGFISQVSPFDNVSYFEHAQGELCALFSVGLAPGLHWP